MADSPPPAAPAARPSPVEWLQLVLLAASLAWTTLGLGGYRPETMVVTLALNGGLLALHLASRAGARGPQPRFHPAGWLPLPFLAYAALNVALVTPVRWLGWLDWLVWAQGALVFWVVLNGLRSRAARTGLFAVLIALGLVAVALAAYQRFVRPDWLMLHRVQADQFIGRASGPFGIPNSLAAFLGLLLPPLLALTLRRGAGAVQRVACGYAAAACAFGLALTISRGAWLALAVAGVGWRIATVRGAWWRRLAAGAAVAVGVVATVWTLYAAVPGVRARLDAMARDRGELTRPVMWRGAWRIFVARPWTGAGAGSYNTLFEAHRPASYQDEPRWAHNDYLNTLADYGVIGGLLALGAAGVIAVRTARGQGGRGSRVWVEDRAVTAAMLAGLAAFALQLLVDFNLKIPALAMSAAALAALAVRARWPDEATAEPATGGRVTLLALAAAVVGFVVAAALPRERAEAWRYAARQKIETLADRRARAAEETEALRGIRGQLARAVALDPANGQAWADRAYATTLWAHVEPARRTALGAEAEAMAARAIALSSVVPEFWIRRGVALDLQGRRKEAGRAFVRALQLAPARSTVWYYQAFHLSLDRSDPGPARAAVDFCLRLDPGNPDALALRQRLIARSGNP